MTQVFATINHGLSEEYGKIELPHQEAKTRYTPLNISPSTPHFNFKIFLDSLPMQNIFIKSFPHLKMWVRPVLCSRL